VLERTVILKSETDAIKAKRLLSKVGIASRMTKAMEGKRGCAVMLRVRDVDPYELIRVLRDNGIDYSFSNE
jgi:hypothetical protein